jgi:hypothetical protein
MDTPCAFMTSFLENVNFDGTVKIAYDDSTTQELPKWGREKVHALKLEEVKVALQQQSVWCTLITGAMQDPGKFFPITNYSRKE